MQMGGSTILTSDYTTNPQSSSVYHRSTKAEIQTNGQQKAQIYTNTPKDHLPLTKEASIHIREKTDQLILLLSGDLTLFKPMDCNKQAYLSINSQSLLKLMSIESVMPSKQFILCFTLFLLPSILTSIKDYSNDKDYRIRWSNYWSFIFSIYTSNEYSGLISFSID